MRGLYYQFAKICIMKSMMKISGSRTFTNILNSRNGLIKTVILGWISAVDNYSTVYGRSSRTKISFYGEG